MSKSYCITFLFWHLLSFSLRCLLVYWPTFSLKFLIHLFLYAGVYCNPCDLYRCVSHWTKSNCDRDMLTVQKCDMINFEIQMVGMHTSHDRASLVFQEHPGPGQLTPRAIPLETLGVWLVWTIFLPFSIRTDDFLSKQNMTKLLRYRSGP